MKQSPVLLDAGQSRLTSWPQCSKTVDSSCVPNIHARADGDHCSVLQRNIGLINHDTNQFANSKTNHLDCVPGGYSMKMEPQESFDDDKVLLNTDISNKENCDDVDGLWIQSPVVNRSNGIPPLHPAVGCDDSRANGASLFQSEFQSQPQQMGTTLLDAPLAVNHHAVPQRTVYRASEAIENYAESLQMELVKYHEITANLEKGKQQLEQQISELIRLCQMRDKELQNMKQMLMKERQLRQQQNRKYMQTEEQRLQLSLAAMGRGRSAAADSDVTHKHLLKFVKLSHQSNGPCDMGNVIASMRIQIKDLWMTSGVKLKLGADNEEWMMGTDYDLIHDHPINHISDGIRNGSCSLIFQIKRHGKPYILKVRKLSLHLNPVPRHVFNVFF